MKIFVSGLLNVETTVAVRGFPIEYYPIDYSFFGINSNVSGVGYNIAKALKTLGDEVNLVSFLGGDEEGRRVVSQLEADEISSGNISFSLKNTPVSAVLFDNEGRRQIYCDLKDIQERSANPEKYTDELKSCDIAAICNINFNRELIKRAKKLGTLTATDVHVLSDVNDEYNRDFMENADILFLSDENLPCEAESFIRQIYKRFHNKIIALGMGDKGAMLFMGDQDKLFEIPAYKSGKIINTIGAGDALFSAFLHYYAKGLSAEKALEKAVVFAGIKIGFNGASHGFSTEKEIDDIINRKSAK